MESLSSTPVVFALTILLCQCIQVSGDDRLCSFTSDCQANECCLSTVPTRGKRDAPGNCRPRGELAALCYVKNDQLQAPDSDVLFLDACPCSSTLECQSTGTVEVPQGEQGRCVATNATKKRADKCSSVGDCAPDECCASLSQPVGRRKRGIGECRKLLQTGDSCLVAMTTTQDVNFECPCQIGLTCKGTGLYEIPLGERGICTA
ncbi:hypothetical protein BsWGS_21775 [Bradybaena similaris]